MKPLEIGLETGRTTMVVGSVVQVQYAAAGSYNFAQNQSKFVNIDLRYLALINRVCVGLLKG